MLIWFKNIKSLLITQKIFIIYSLFILSISFIVFFVNYDKPDQPFWDEGYHIASSQKYLEGIYFQEPHPPLGKLFIALGEKITNANTKETFDELYLKKFQDENKRSYDEDNLEDVTKLEKIKKEYAFTNTDFIKEYPPNYSFKGVRLFPVIFAFLSSYLFFVLLYFISKNLDLSFLFSFFYIFNNAFVIHFRSAMLDSILMFFVLATLSYFVWIWNLKTRNQYHYFIFSFLLALAVMTKVNSLVLGFLILPLLYKDIKELWSEFKQKKFWNIDFIILKSFYAFLAFCLVVFNIQTIHLSLGKNFAPDRVYNTSLELKEAIEQKKTDNFVYTLLSFYDWLKYSQNYTLGVPALDVCKADENGSYPLDWILGGRAISYRWDKYIVEKNDYDKSGIFTQSFVDMKLDELAKMDESQKNNYYIVVRYAYLIFNPLILLLGIFGLILSSSYILAVFVFKLKIFDKNIFSLMLIFNILYWGYMIPVLNIERVLYMYHYFIPLIFSLILFFLVILNFYKQHKEEKQQKILIIMALLSVVVIITFLYFSPFSYYLPLNEKEFMARNWFKIWQMRSAGY